MLRQFPPMGVYETLFAFADATGRYMGDPGTHPWAQGFPLTSQLPDGPEIPSSVSFDASQLKYPLATGHDALRQAIVDDYNERYDAGITQDHVAVFAGGRPAILAILAFLLDDTTLAVEATEYTPYWDMARLFGRRVHLIPSDEGNRFRPTAEDYDVAPLADTSSVLLLKSNPCNPTGVTLRGNALRDLVAAYTDAGRGAVFDEAYEYFNAQGAESALRWIDDIDSTDLFVIGAATKGLQVPGARVGWVVAAKHHIELFRNYSSIGMGGVSRPSQILVTQLLERDRVRHAREAVRTFYDFQRDRYGRVLAELGCTLFSGDGGFYHWVKLPHGLTASQFNERLFRHHAAILPGPLCDMTRSGDTGPLGHFVRFSFGPLPPESFEGDIEILRQVLQP